MAKDPPSKEEDPDWSPEDVRYSVIRYITTDIQNAQGPHVHDPRTGETVYRLANIRRDEPSAELFKVPDDYKVKSRGRG